jgi:hypothetical protein
MAVGGPVAVSRQAIFEASAKYFLAVMGPLLEDDSVTEIMANGCEEI